MGTYDRQIATAKRLIGKSGRACVWRAIIDGAAPDADKPWKKGDDQENDYDVKLLFLPDTRSNMAFLQSLGSEAINVGDDYGLIAAVDFVPTNRAEIYDETGTTLLRGVKSVEPLAPNGDVILYTIRFTVAT